jgi:hypothetical protein
MLGTNQHEAEELGLAMRNLAEVSACEEMVVYQVFSAWRRTLAAIEEFRSLSREVCTKIEKHILRCVYAGIEEVYPVLPSRICMLSPMKRAIVTVVVQGKRVDRCPFYRDATKLTLAETPVPAEKVTSCTVSPVDIIERCVTEISAVDLERDEYLTCEKPGSKRRKI